MIPINNKILACRSPLSNGIGKMDYVFLVIIPECEGLIISTLYNKNLSEVVCHDSATTCIDIYLDLMFKGWLQMSKDDITITFGNIL